MTKQEKLKAIGVDPSTVSDDVLKRLFGKAPAAKPAQPRSK